MSTRCEPDALKRYYESLRCEIWERLNTSEEGSTQEQAFTQYTIDLLAEAGEIENARECRDEKLDKTGRRQHKINGYSLSENLETVQLFCTIFKGSEDVQKTYKADVDAAVSQSTRFLKNALNGVYEEMEPTAPAFDFARELGRNGKDIERTEIFILTDGTSDVDKPDDQQIRNVLIMYRVIDICYMMRLEGGQPDPIEINFEDFGGQAIPCLTIPVTNPDYQSYLAVIPGGVLADIYKRYGARLLEMNVRSFLQFTGKINKGIRDTINKEPHMFLAFNNGIAATAEEVELVDMPQGGKAIRAVRELQIVNGGQTTASILHTRQKDKADVEQLFVQMKLSVIRNHDEVSTIVNRISRYANSQNKVSDADLTANSPFHIEVEKLSRYLWAPPQPGMNYQTRWFYERARGQYRNALAKELTPKQKAAFSAQTPKNQVLVKEDLAKFVNLWAMLPHHVVRGNQKNYLVFMSSLRKRDLKPDSVFFEDLIAKAILFRTAERIYGVKPNAIGDLRYVTVPYTIAYLNQVTDGRLDLLGIWKRQRLSDELCVQLHSLMIQIEKFIKAKAPGSLYGEWAKKEDCWEQVNKQTFAIDLVSVSADLTDPVSVRKRSSLSEQDTDRLASDALNKWLRSVPAAVWKQIGEWGYTTAKLSMRQRDLIRGIGIAVISGRKFNDAELRGGPEILEWLMAEAPELFSGIKDEPETTVTDKQVQTDLITLDLVKQMVSYERRRKCLKDSHFLFMNQIAKGEKPLTDSNLSLLRNNLKVLESRGFSFIRPEE